MFQETYPKALTRICVMSYHDKECYIQAYNKCDECEKVFKSKASKVCKVCFEVDDCIDKIVKELSLPPIVVVNQLLSHDQLQAKLKDHHMKRTIELRRLEELVDGMLENFVVYPTKATSKLWEFVKFLQI